MAAIHFKKATQTAREPRLATAEASDVEAFAKEEDADNEYDVIHECDTVEYFELIDENEAVENYVVIDMTNARRVTVEAAEV